MALIWARLATDALSGASTQKESAYSRAPLKEHRTNFECTGKPYNIIQGLYDYKVAHYHLHYQLLCS